MDGDGWVNWITDRYIQIIKAWYYRNAKIAISVKDIKAVYAG